MGDRINCREAHARLQDYLKQELTPELASQVAEHLEHCRPCFQHAKFERSFLMTLQSKGKRTCCPDALRARILAVLRAEGERD